MCVIPWKDSENSVKHMLHRCSTLGERETWYSSKSHQAWLRAAPRAVVFRGFRKSPQPRRHRWCKSDEAHGRGKAGGRGARAVTASALNIDFELSVEPSSTLILVSG